MAAVGDEKKVVDVSSPSRSGSDDVGLGNVADGMDDLGKSVSGQRKEQLANMTVADDGLRRALKNRKILIAQLAPPLREPTPPQTC
jgi:hypothetical protein